MIYLHDGRNEKENRLWMRGLCYVSMANTWAGLGHSTWRKRQEGVEGRVVETEQAECSSDRS